MLAFLLTSIASAAVIGHQLRAVAKAVNDPDTKVINEKTGETYNEFKNRTGDHKSGEWSYADTHSWASFGNPFCDGSSQSPVDIVTANVSTESFLQKSHQQPTPAPGPLLGHLKYMALDGRTIENHGHNVQVNGNFGTFELHDSLYDVVQFQFHFPSEHAVNGKLKTGELQILHRQQGTRGTASLAVVSILLQTEHPALMAHLEQERESELNFLYNLGFGSVLPQVGEKLPVKGTVDILTAFKRVLDGGFYHYHGSLTTPPCSETVHWYVMQFPALVTPEMVQTFKDIFHDPANNRPVQPLNGRDIGFNLIWLDGESDPSYDDFARHAFTHNISQEQAKYHIQESHVGPSVQEHHGQTGASPGEFFPEPDHVPPKEHAGACHMTIGVALLLAATGMLRT